MSEFFDNIPDEQAEEIESLSRALYELREQRDIILQRYGASDEEGIMTSIENGAMQEHPGYEDYLAATILRENRDMVRQALQEYLAEVQKG